jgi:hypothetical protein
MNGFTSQAFSIYTPSTEQVHIYLIYVVLAIIFLVRDSQMKSQASGNPKVVYILDAVAWIDAALGTAINNWERLNFRTFARNTTGILLLACYAKDKVRTLATISLTAAADSEILRKAHQQQGQTQP